MARSRELRVVLTGDARGFRRATLESEKSLDRLRTRGSAAMRALGRSAALGGVAIAGGLAVGLKKATDAAIEAEKAQARLNAQLDAIGKNTPRIRKEIDETVQSLSAMTGFDDEDLQDSFVNIARTTGDVNEALRLNALAADLARAKQLDVARAGEIVAKVAGGNVGILGRYGIQLERGASASEALAALQQRVAGQAEAYGETTAGSMDRAGVAVENLGESIGAVLAPGLSAASGAVARFVNQMQSGEGAGGNFARVVRTTFTDAREAVGSAIRSIGSWLDRNREELRSLGQNIQTIFRDGVVPTFQFVLSVVRRVFPAVVGVVRGMAEAIRGIVDILAGILRGDFGRAWDGVRRIFSGGARAVLGTLRALTAPFREVASRAGDALRGPLSAAFRSLRTAATAAISLILGALDKFLGGMSSTLSFAARIPGIGGRFRAAAEGIDAARESIRRTRDELNGLPTRRSVEVFIRFRGQSIPPLRPLNELRPAGAGLPLTVRELAEEYARRQGRRLTPLFQRGLSDPLRNLGGRSVSRVDSFTPIARRFGLQMTSGYRAGDDGWHGVNRARDYSNSTGPTPQMLAFARYMAANFGSRLKELFYTPLGWSIKNGQRVGWTVSGHHNHVHVALQRGGSIPGHGDGDKVPALLEPGEFVVNRRATGQFRPLLQAMNEAIPRFQTGGEVVRSLWSAMQGMVGKRERLRLRFFGGRGVSPWEAETVHTKHGAVVSLNDIAGDALTGRGRRRSRALELVLHELAHGLQSRALTGSRYSVQRTEGGAQAWVRLFGRDALQRAGIGGRPSNVMYRAESDWVLQNLPRSWIERKQFGLQRGGEVPARWLRAARALRSAGFRASALRLGLAVGGAESGNYTDFIGDGGNSVSPWQIHLPSHPQYNRQRLLSDWDYAARAVWSISGGGRNWRPWTVFRTGAYRGFMGLARRAAIASGRGRGGRGDTGGGGSGRQRGDGERRGGIITDEGREWPAANEADEGITPEDLGEFRPIEELRGEQPDAPDPDEGTRRRIDLEERAGLITPEEARSRRIALLQARAQRLHDESRGFANQGDQARADELWLQHLEARGDLREALDSLRDSLDQNTAVQQAAAEALSRRNELLEQQNEDQARALAILSTQAATAVRALADMTNAQIGGYMGQRGRTAGHGAVARA